MLQTWTTAQVPQSLHHQKLSAHKANDSEYCRKPPNTKFRRQQKQLSGIALRYERRRSAATLRLHSRNTAQARIIPGQPTSTNESPWPLGDIRGPGPVRTSSPITPDMTVENNPAAR